MLSVFQCIADSSWKRSNYWQPTTVLTMSVLHSGRQGIKTFKWTNSLAWQCFCCTGALLSIFAIFQLCLWHVYFVDRVKCFERFISSILPNFAFCSVCAHGHTLHLSVNTLIVDIFGCFMRHSWLSCILFYFEGTAENYQYHFTSRIIDCVIRTSLLL